MLDVSVAICTWNRRDLLDQTLSGMEKMPIGNLQWELLVIDNGSSDGTADLVTQWIQRGSLPIRYVLEPTLGVSHARNRALREARADWLLFADDDVLVDPDWLSAFKAATERHPNAGAVGGRVDPWFVETPDPEVSKAFPAVANGFCGVDLGSDERVVPAGTFLVGASFGVRISAAKCSFPLNLGPRGPNPVGGEENAYQMQLREAGRDIIWCPAMRLRHYVDPKRTTLEYLRRYYRNLGRHSIILEGIPQGPRLGGVPRWLLRRYVDHWVSFVWNKLSGNRVAALVALRQRAFLHGMIAECRRSQAGRT